MLAHDLLLIYRNFIRAKGYFVINLVGLVSGLTCTLLIYLWVTDELSVNQFHAADARLFQVMEHQQYAEEIMTTTSTPGILAETLKADFPEVEYAATLTWASPMTVSDRDHNVKAQGFSVGPDFFRIFSYPLVQGRAEQVLTDKLSIVISESLARKLFRDADQAVGKVVEVQHDKSFTVTGVFADLPAASSLQFEFVTSFELFQDENPWVKEWDNNGPSTVLTLHAGVDANAFAEKIKDFIKTKAPDTHISLFLQKYSDRYLYGRFENGQPAGGRIEYVQLFSIIAIFILLIACINFMNLATARASRKAKEVGIKKTVGAHRGALIRQFLTESLVLTTIAAVFSVALVLLLLPAFNFITEKRIVLSFAQQPIWLGLLAITAITGLLSGSYPAVYLSGFQPVAVLKGEARGSWGELWARKGLVVFQFFLSVILIVSVLVVYRQLAYVQAKNLGFNKEQLIRFPIEGELVRNRAAFLTEVRRLPGVAGATSMGHTMVGRNNNTSGLQWEGKNPDDLILFENISADHQLLETLGVELVEGRTFREDTPADTSKIILNEAAIRAMGLADPIGKTIRLWDQFDLEIIGIVKDFHFQSLHDAVSPLFFRLAPENSWNVLVRLHPGNTAETLEKIRAVYNKLNPGFSFEYVFLDAEYARQYAAEQRVASLSLYFASMAIVISCLGLFGLSAFTAERRRKEIGIRKALGSNVRNIVVLLSGDFMRVVGVAVLAGLPVSYWLLARWLERFEYRMELSWYYFVLAGVLALVIAGLTVASQAWKAARLNPVKSLRSE